MLTGTSKIFELEDNQYGYNIERCNPTPFGGYMKMYIPKIMGQRSKGTESFSGKSIFANEVKPSCASTISKRDYVLVPRLANQTWSDKLDNEGKVPKWTKHTIEFLNGNVSKPYMTTK